MPKANSSISKYTSANKVAWNDVEKKHRPSIYEKLLQNFSVPDYSYLGELETQVLHRLGLKGKSVAQLACNNGREIISIKNLGAAHCTGFDISENFIAQGKDFIRIGNVDNCELVVFDIYQIPEDYNNLYDIIFVSVGVLIYMPDLPLFFSVAARLLKSGGKIFIYERHPILSMFVWENMQAPPAFVDSYFNTESKRNTNTLNYWTKETINCSPLYTFHHKLSDIFRALISNNFEIQDFEEYQHDISEKYAAFEKLEHKLPLCYTLTAKLKK